MNDFMDDSVNAPADPTGDGAPLELPRRGVVRPYMLTRGRTSSSLGAFELHAPVLALIATDQLGKHATLHPLDTADHGFKTLKGSRTSEEDVFVEMARVVRDWASGLV